MRELELVFIHEYGGGLYNAAGIVSFLPHIGYRVYCETPISNPVTSIGGTQVYLQYISGLLISPNYNSR